MKYRKLGTTDLDVSVICLGTMTFGQQNTEEEGHRQLDYALDQGVNFFDTAELYSVPPKAETYGATERILGTWDKLHSQRDKIILATKAMGPMQRGGYAREDGSSPRFTRKSLMEAIDKSLARLKLDYVDLYQLHWPDRDTNYFGQMGFRYNPEEEFTPIEETLEVLSEIQKSGKVRYFGLSNETPWGVMEFLRLSREKNLPRMMSIQNPYSLLNRLYEVGLAEMSIRENIGLLAYSPMGFGVLSGKYLDATPEDGRVTLFPRFDRYNHPNATAATRKYVTLARENGLSPAQMALAWVNSRPFVTANIIGATKMQQLEENIASIDVELSPEVIQGIEEIHKEFPNPSP